MAEVTSTGVNQVHPPQRSTCMSRHCMSESSPCHKWPWHLPILKNPPKLPNDPENSKLPVLCLDFYSECSSLKIKNTHSNQQIIPLSNQPIPHHSNRSSTPPPSSKPHLVTSISLDSKPQASASQDAMGRLNLLSPPKHHQSLSQVMKLSTKLPILRSYDVFPIQIGHE